MHKWALPLYAAAAFLAATAHGAEFYVSADGDDAAPGDQARPFATLERARTAVRESGRAGQETVVVHVRGGTYRRAHAFRLEGADSGSERFPVVYQESPGEEVAFIGAVPLPNGTGVPAGAIRDRLPEVARASVMQVHLPPEQMPEFGQIGQPGRQMELFAGDAPMRLARWPDDGFTRVGELLGQKPFTSHGIQGDYTGTFRFEGDRPQRWKDEPEIWLHGYWFWDWSDSYERIEALDIERGLIVLRQPYHHYGYRPGQRYYALNLLAELDQPGEWQFDRERRTIYFWPPALAPHVLQPIIASKLEHLIQMENCSHVVLRGFTLKACRGTALEINQGNGVQVEDLTILNTGSYGVRVRGGTGHRVSRCHIYQTGEGGIELAGGDRRSLTPSGHAATDNTIHGFGRIFRTYRPAVLVSGVGQRVAHNLIYDGPHNAIQLSGNEHQIEYNEIHHVCYETGDVGAFYMGRDWTARGTVIRHNYFHDIQGPGLHGAMAVYLDDSASGITVFGNLFVRAGRAAFIGGGRDNRIENNVFVECAPAVHVDARGLNWMKDSVADGGVLPQRLADMPYREPHWTNRYPELLTLLQDQPGAPKGNTVTRNVVSGGRWLDLEKAADGLVKFADNWTRGDPGFVDIQNGNYQFTPDAPVYKTGFQKLPLEKIGPRRSALDP